MPEPTYAAVVEMVTSECAAAADLPNPLLYAGLRLVQQSTSATSPVEHRSPTASLPVHDPSSTLDKTSKELDRSALMTSGDVGLPAGAIACDTPPLPSWVAASTRHGCFLRQGPTRLLASRQVEGFQYMVYYPLHGLRPSQSQSHNRERFTLSQPNTQSKKLTIRTHFFMSFSSLVGCCELGAGD